LGLDKNLGSRGENAANTTMTLTTSAAAAAPSRVVLYLVWNNGSGTLSSVTGGGLTWTIDRQVKDGTNYWVGIASADAPFGLATNQVITARFSRSVAHGLIAAASFTGVAPGAAVDASASTTQDGVIGWSAGVTTTNPTDLVVGWSTIDANATSVPTAPNLEIHDFGNSTFFSWATSTYRIEATAGAKTVNGTWSRATGSTANATIAVAYRAG
jgi:hypothetical protein